jgi:hypothetical protein
MPDRLSSPNRPPPHAVLDGIIDQKRAEKERDRQLLWYARCTFYAAVGALVVGIVALVVGIAGVVVTVLSSH